MKKSTAKRLLRIVPITMQLLGVLGAGVGGWYSLAMLMGSGIGSPTGQANPELYNRALVLTGCPNESRTVAAALEPPVEAGPLPLITAGGSRSFGKVAHSGAIAGDGWQNGPLLLQQRPARRFRF